MTSCASRGALSRACPPRTADTRALSLRRRARTCAAQGRLTRIQVKEQVPARSTYVDTHGIPAERGYSLREGGEHGVNTGNAAGSRTALGMGRSLIFQCPTCYSMVDLRAASREALAAGREVHAGDAWLSGMQHSLQAECVRRKAVVTTRGVAGWHNARWCACPCARWTHERGAAAGCTLACSRFA